MSVEAPYAVFTKVLVVDDDPIVLRAVSEILRRDGHHVVAVDDAVEGLTLVSDSSFDVVCLDITMPNVSGMELLRAFKLRRPDVEVIMMTAFATVETAVTAVKNGAFDYLTKPFESIDVLALSVRRAIEKRSLVSRARVLEEAIASRDSFDDFVGRSSSMRSVFKLVETISHSSATVLIQGESGTGKELVARAIHFRSPRRERPFIAVNCSAFTESLLQSELFGHVRGAFTRDRPTDIPLLAQHFLQLYAKKAKKKLNRISDDAMALLAGGWWRGNVRELENVIERAVVLAPGDEVGIAQLPEELHAQQRSDGNVDVFALSQLEYIQAKRMATLA